MIEPELWGKSSTFLSSVHLKSLTEIKNSLKWKNNESIFEFGMGDGSNSKSVLFPILPDNYKEFIGSDVSRRMVEYLRRNSTDPRARFVLLDISADSIPKEFVNRFDHIFGFAVMHWVKDTRKALKNMYKMLKPEGQMLLTYADETSADEVYYEFSLHPKWKKYDHTKLISPFFRRKNVMEEYNKLFEEAGFKEISSTVEQLASKLTDENMFYDFCISINPILSMVSNEEYEEYKDEYIYRMKNNKLNKTMKCPKTGEISCYTSAVITSVLLEKL
ncbi:juvenile hormone acid O-methyltransferase-like [Diabrotica virgifera virgifera]|uniref:Methyltransferase type 12 domain-containing protein n=1 Tax=Diabrotica virgifera virgifera TaxID=50390 RepID=A0ABM5IT37_DIAVI|nr:juvenile hormone acid O-methyltransferase-like [Diabrotica virgifera virgifera]XP_028141121.2 juvenile hormone acid O-methyltransferase-like [Diabrotica virgifera virgifera]XP_028141122.2 juvenile hormone acid O-methyltransferase-like [Diabrotica virgifera virgifera]